MILKLLCKRLYDLKNAKKKKKKKKKNKKKKKKLDGTNCI